VASSTTEVPDMVVSGGTVTGRVTRMATGKALRPETIVLCCDYFRQLPAPNQLDGSQPRIEGPRRGTPFIPTISADGGFVFPFVPSGNYALSVADRQIIPVSWPLAVGANGVTGLQLEVMEGAGVQGTVLDQTGRPVPASVTLRPKPANSAFSTIGPPTETSGQSTAGSFSTLNVSKDSNGIFSLVGVQRFIPGAFPSLDQVRNRLQEVAYVHAGKAALDGTFSFWVYPGAYVLEVESNGVTLPKREIQVGIEGLKNISFQVPAIQTSASPVTGRVVAPGGGALPKLNYVRFVRSGSDSDVFYGFPDNEGRFSLTLDPGEYRVFTERLGRPVQSVSDGSRDITNTAFTLEGGRVLQIVVTLEP
ncbi:MAG TPA: hypothetical protein VFY29_19435, partial [Terriglobia bacterium]|nr:hypothetical protein [Terriglobia bacterium]